MTGIGAVCAAILSKRASVMTVVRSSLRALERKQEKQDPVGVRVQFASTDGNEESPWVQMPRHAAKASEDFPAERSQLPRCLSIQGRNGC